MKLLITIGFFIATLGYIFLSGGFSKSENKKNELAQIVQHLDRNSPTLSSSPKTKISKIPSQTKTPTSILISTPSYLPSITPTQSVTVSPTPTQTRTSPPAPTPPTSPEPTLTPIITPVPTSTTQPTSGHIYYTSSHWKAKYYYCDTDKEWRDLSPTYLKSFNSSEELLVKYPTRILHAPCQ